MDEIRMLSSADFDAYVAIVANAYPGWKLVTPEDRERTKQRLLDSHEKDPSDAYYGFFRDGQLLGGMRLIDYTMNFLGVRIPVGGLGLLAVDLLHKKMHVARDLVAYFLRHYRGRDAPFALLYPFRPDFYKQMGFGYSTKMSQYRLRPAALPKGPSKAHVRALGEADIPALTECYNLVARRTHGMIERPAFGFERLFRNPQLRLVGYEQDGHLLGYLAFTFETGENMLVNDLHVQEFVHQSRAALSELLTFLHSQADQVRHVVINTQDEAFHHLLQDPRNGTTTIIPSAYHESNIQGVGLMHRVIDTARLFDLLREQNFGGQTCQLKLTIADSFLPENAGSTLLRFEDGFQRPAKGDGYDAEVRLEVAEFSSLLAGTVNFRSLHRYNLADVSDPAYLDTVDRLFTVADKPICMTVF